MPAEERTYRGRTLPDFIRPDKEKQSSRRFLGGDETTTIVVQLKTVTPILGGGYRTRELDDVDVIRVPTIRGHLRFWWRALYAHEYKGAKELYQAECKLWGGAGGEEKEGENKKKNMIGKSQVELSVEITSTGETVKPDKYLRGDPSYAVWPARGERGWERDNKKKPPAQLCDKTEFTLTVICPKGGQQEQQVRNALKAWILFGGYGSRTRRGLGSLTVTKVKNGDEEEKVKDKWLPKEATKDAINKLFEGLDPLGKEVGEEDKFKGDTPRLPGALLYVKDTKTKAEDAWVKALNKLKDFRQGTTGDQGERAREPDPNPRGNRASISNWPEADKVRRLSRGNNWSHRPRHNNNPVWPRAGFGLPIVGRFQTKGRKQERLTEPRPFTIMWKHGQKTHDRLASPLILKPLPLTGDRFVPCALWLNRGYPKDGVVYVEGNGISNSEAPFDKLTADNDKVLFKPLKNKESLRKAFLDWLVEEGFKEVN
jgi:CRISPR-associated protein Cmr1